MSSFRVYTSLFCINLALVYTTIILIAREELEYTGWFGVFLLLCISNLPLFWHMGLLGVFSKKVKLKGIQFIFLIPIISYAGFLLYRLVVGGDSMETILLVFQNVDSGYFEAQVILNQLFFAISAIIGVLKYKTLVGDFRTLFPDNEAIRWIRNSGLVIGLSSVLLHCLTFIDFKHESLYFVPILMVHFFIWLLVSFIRYPEIFREFHISSMVMEARKEQQKSVLDLSKLREYADVMDKYMFDNKVYLNQDIDVQSLAQSIQIKVYEASSILNQVKGVNFNQYINKFRVDEAKRRIESNESGNMTVEAIGQEVGFKSKSSFYLAFKNFTGMTPSQFIKHVGSREGNHTI